MKAPARFVCALAAAVLAALLMRPNGVTSGVTDAVDAVTSAATRVDGESAGEVRGDFVSPRREGPARGRPAPTPPSVAAREGTPSPAGTRPTDAAGAAKATVRVEVHWDAAIAALGRPRPQLFRVQGTELVPIPAPGRPRVHPALAAMQRTDAADPPIEVAEYEVAVPAEYLVTWTAWRPVAGTRTWRACRGEGERFRLSDATPRSIVLSVDRDAMALDPELDLPRPDGTWRWTEKDGD